LTALRASFYLLIVGMRGSERHRADSGSIFVVNSVIQFAQQHRLMQEPRLGVKFNSDVPLPRHALLPTFFTCRPRGAQARPGGSNFAEIHESSFSLYSARVRLAYALVLRLRHTGLGPANSAREVGRAEKRTIRCVFAGRVASGHVAKKGRVSLH
jgi:hypothetical protein